MRPTALCAFRRATVLAARSAPSTAEIAALLHIDPPKTGPKSFWELACTFPNSGVGMKFYRKVRAAHSPAAPRRAAPRR